MTFVTDADRLLAEWKDSSIFRAEQGAAVSRIEWDETLETGHADVDAQHKELIAMFNDLHDAAVRGASDEVLDDLLGRLVQYTMTHFKAEQQLMVDYGYPPEDVMIHVTAHNELTRRALEMARQREAGELTGILPLAAFLGDWLANHIRKMDRALVAHIRGRTAAVRPDIA